RERHTTMRTGIAQGERTALLVSPNDQRDFKQHGFHELAATGPLGRQGTVPEAEKHQRVGSLLLGRFVGHIRDVLYSLGQSAAAVSDKWIRGPAYYSEVGGGKRRISARTAAVAIVHS